jgi:tetratricopeptide (TPR) repeat protein
MELTIKPGTRNIYPRRGMLVRGEGPRQWVEQLRQMRLSIADTKTYPLPGVKANTVWGCLMTGPMPADIGSNNLLQCAHGLLFLPEYCQLYPAVSEAELSRMLGGKMHLFHPEVGWVELPDAVDWKALTIPSVRREGLVRQPAEGVLAPSRVKSFQLYTTGPLDALNEMTNAVSDGKILEQGPLSWWEKVKMWVLRFLFPKGEIKGWWGEFGKRLGARIKIKWIEKLKEKLMDLEERNNLEAGKLLELFRRDPKEALKYAIPLDEGGTSRGGGSGAYEFRRRWRELSFGLRHQNSRSSSVSLGGDYVTRIRKQYMESAQDFISHKQYREAAFVYLRLLKNYTLAADTLEKGGLYAEAASVYLEYLKNNLKAAECYEKGSFTLKAIEIYQEMGNNEKVGDLYVSLHRRKEARIYYEEVIKKYVGQSEYIKASHIYRDKVGEGEPAKRLLMEGWEKNANAVHCLNAYFTYFSDKAALEQEIKRIYVTNNPDGKKIKFLEVMKHQFDRHPGLREAIRDIAFEIVAGRIEAQPSFASELQAFTKNDPQLLKDILRYQQRQKRG